MDETLPLIDVSGLRHGSPDPATARAIDDACRASGFFRVVGHGIPRGLLRDLDRQARAFFARPDAEKERVAMRHAGAAWRGWFPLGGELTSGRPDQKEGYYFGVDHPADHPGVVGGLPLHGPNLYPEHPAGLRPAVDAWMAAATALGRRLLQGIAAGLGLDPRWFDRNVTAEPTVLFRIFRYPPADAGWGVAEHTDYGLLTILAQDGHDGLEVRGPDGWVAVPGDADVLVVNLGDMLERMTNGRYLSTPHRVRPRRGDGDRLSFPCFVDPSWDAVCPTPPLDDAPGPSRRATSRWDGADPRAWEGTYGDYLTAKVARVFPALRDHVAPGGPPAHCARLPRCDAPAAPMAPAAAATWQPGVQATCGSMTSTPRGTRARRTVGTR